MSSIFKYIILKLKRHYKLEMTTIFLLLLFFITTICLVSINSTAVFVKQYVSAKYEDYTLSKLSMDNEFYKNNNLDDKVLARFAIGCTSYQADDGSWKQRPMAVMEEKFLEAFPVSFKTELKEDVDIKIIASYKFKDKYVIGEKREFYVDGEIIEGTVVGYTKEELLLTPEGLQSLVHLWSDKAEIMVFVKDINIISQAYDDVWIHALYDLPYTKVLELDPNHKYFSNIKFYAEITANGALEAFYTYIILTIVFAAAIIYSINYILFNETLKKEIAVECLIGATKKSMIIANFILLMIESCITSALYYLVYTQMVNKGLMYATSFGRTMIGFIFISFVIIFIARIFTISTNKILSNLHTDGD